MGIAINGYEIVSNGTKNHYLVRSAQTGKMLANGLTYDEAVKYVKRMQKADRDLLARMS